MVNMYVIILFSLIQNIIQLGKERYFCYVLVMNLIMQTFLMNRKLSMK